MFYNLSSNNFSYHQLNSKFALEKWEQSQSEDVFWFLYSFLGIYITYLKILLYPT